MPLPISLTLNMGSCLSSIFVYLDRPRTPGPRTDFWGLCVGDTTGANRHRECRRQEGGLTAGKCVRGDEDKCTFCGRAIHPFLVARGAVA